MAAARRRTLDDVELQRRAAAGDEAAFAELDSRYRRPLVRYARTLLRRSEHDADDVVQDVLIRAHAALAAGEGPEELRPWLYRLTRNRAIDEVRRARFGADAPVEAAPDPGADPVAVLSRREAVRRLVDDLARLPPRQRAALLARELDGFTPDQVADELGVTVPAAQMLAARARAGLVKARAARDADCEEIRGELALAHERGVRGSEHARRHLAGCPACRAHERDLRRLSRRLRVLAPPPLIAPALAAAKLLTGTGVKVAAIVAMVGGGVAVTETHLFSAGHPAPFSLRGDRAILGHTVTTGAALPSGTAVVTARVTVPAGRPTGAPRSVTLSCPAGTRVEGLAAPERRQALEFGLAAGTAIGDDRRARIELDGKALAKPATLTVAITCHRLGRGGSLALHPRHLRPGERAARVCVPNAMLRHRPGRVFVGTVSRNEPVAVQKLSPSGKWARVATDFRAHGWIPTRALQLSGGRCRAGRSGP